MADIDAATRLEEPGAAVKRRAAANDDRAGTLTALLGRYGLPMLGATLVILFSALKPESFATWDNYRSILDNQAIVVLLAFAAMLPLIVGKFDLSVAAVLSLSHILAVGFIVKQNLSPALSIAATLASCVLIGLFNGFVVVKLKVDAFVATLASGSIIGGIALWYTAGKTIFEPVPPSFTDLARGSLFGLPHPVWYVLVVGVVLGLVLSALPMGRRMYATGGNERAARLTGIPTDRYVMSSFVASGVLAGTAGVILGSRLGTASPATGASLLLPAFAGAFLGATTIRPGRFNVAGTVVAVYTLAVTVSGLQQLGAPVWFEPVFNGAALILSVALSHWALQQRRERARARQLRALSASAP